MTSMGVAVSKDGAVAEDEGQPARSARNTSKSRRKRPFCLPYLEPATNSRRAAWRFSKDRFCNDNGYGGGGKPLGSIYWPKTQELQPTLPSGQPPKGLRTTIEHV